MDIVIDTSAIIAVIANEPEKPSLIRLTSTEARQNLATLLDKAASEGEVRLKRRDDRFRLSGIDLANLEAGANRCVVS